MKNYSSLRIRDIKPILDKIGLIKIYINNQVMWDDEKYADAQSSRIHYEQLFDNESLVANIHLQIVLGHHFVAYIETASAKTRDK